MMKREILCQACIEKMRKLFPSDNPYPGEHIKRVIGKARQDFECDNCGQPVATGDECMCFSIYKDGGYLEWEYVFIDYERPLKGKYRFIGDNSWVLEI
uniref:Uncharacterized protein n=2 Tax=viral metagenome TaxID=1070528 RepID=A0A6M3LFE4_9ZZZZ